METPQIDLSTLASADPRVALAIFAASAAYEAYVKIRAAIAAHGITDAVLDQIEAEVEQRIARRDAPSPVTPPPVSGTPPAGSTG